MKWFWLGVALFMGVGEFITRDLLLIIFSIAAVASFGVALSLSFLYQLGTFIFLSVILFILTKKLNIGSKKVEKELIGEEGIVVESIQKIYCDRGLVRINGELWRAYTEGKRISPGTNVIVVDQRGIKLKVKSKK